MMFQPPELEYGKHLVPHGHDEVEFLLDAPVPLVGFRDCYAINASVVCNEPAGMRTSDLTVGLVGQWQRLYGFSNPLTRIEFLSDPGTSERLGLRGAVIYDSARHPVFHFVHALLNYDGDGPEMSRQILIGLGVSESMIGNFVTIIKRVAQVQESYAAVLQRDFDGEQRWYCGWRDVLD